VVQRPTGEIVILQRALVVRSGHVYAVCSQCKLDVPVPALGYETRSIFVSEDETESQIKKDLRSETPGAIISTSGSQVTETPSPKS